MQMPHSGDKGNSMFLYKRHHKFMQGANEQNYINFTSKAAELTTTFLM